jgi:hypothetical protein
MENDVVCIQRQHNHYEVTATANDAVTKEKTAQLMGALP